MKEKILFSEKMKDIEAGLGIKHAVFTKRMGIISHRRLREADEGACKIKADMSEFLGIDNENFLFCHQKHTARVIVIRDKKEKWDIKDSPFADAIVTDVKGMGVGVFTADCVPILMAGRKQSSGSVIAAVHSGWKSAISGIIENAVLEMEKLGCVRDEIVAFLGPCIKQESYEVGEEFFEQFIAADKNNGKLFSKINPKKWLFDLEGYALTQLNKAGIKNVDKSPLDTYINTENGFLESYRYKMHRGNAGRLDELSSVIALV
ncbi:MAG: polyphenol oxidase family protein [Alphaproteobacteria bacterium]|nr:polyphenol oxidase family protein [Alphaproteobacteria bacterium]MCL2505356.1 polyphenol oxidase family protein [Alphaproteobacteria bacterium]